jgi:signal transduction histidine kinase
MPPVRRFLQWGLIRLFGFLWVVSGTSSASAQAPDDKRALVMIYDRENESTIGINDVCFDNNGTLWLAPINYNILSFDGRTFNKLKIEAAAKEDVYTFSHIKKDANGHLLFISYDLKYVFRLDGNGRFSLDSTLSSQGANIPDIPYYFNWNLFVQCGRSGEIKKIRQELKDRLSGNRSFSPLDDSVFLFDEKDVHYLYKDDKLTITRDRKALTGQVAIVYDELVRVEKNKLIALDEQSRKEKEIALTGDILADTAYRDFLKGGAGGKTGVYASLTLFHSAISHIAYDNKLYRISAIDKFTFKTVFICDLSFLHSSINRIEYNAANDLTILACQKDGLILIRPNPFYPAAFSPSFRQLKKTRVFYPISVTEGDLFLTSWAEFSGKGYFKLFTQRRPEGSKCFFLDHAGNRWMGFRHKIIQYDLQMREVKETSLPAQETVVTGFCENEKDDLFCLTTYSVRPYKNGNFESPVVNEYCTKNKITFQTMAYMGDGKFWIGSTRGLYIYDSYSNSIKKSPFVPDDLILNVAKLNDGSVLLSCYQQDYNYYYHDHHFYKIPVGKHVGLTEIMSIREDNNGRIWLTTNKGLYVTTREEINRFCSEQNGSVYYYKYDLTDGLTTMEFNGGLNPSNAINREGYLAFNSMDGLIIFHQDSVRQYFPENGIFITSIVQGGRSVQATDSIELKNEYNATIVQLAVPYYHNMANLELEYKIAGFREAWTEVDENGKILIDHLPHGAYTLSIRAKTGFGPGKYFTRSIAVKVAPLFYETVFFRVLAGTFLLSLCLFITYATIKLKRRKSEIKWKNASLEQKSIELEEMVGELELAVDEIAESKLKLQENINLKEKLISLILHDLKSPLYSQSLIFNVLSYSNFFINEEARDLFLGLKNSNAAIVKFIQDFLTWYSSQKDGFIVKRVKFEHTRLIDDVFYVYSDIAARKKLELLYEKNGSLLLFTDKNILEIIFRNILDNAIKYTQKGVVSLKFEKGPGEVRIIVTDTGIGMKPETIQRLEGYSNKLHHETTQTFGYRFIYTLAEKIGAAIEIRSEAGKGTTVIIIIPDLSGETSSPTSWEI